MLLPPRPKMPFGQRHDAINIYNICIGHFGSKGGKHLKQIERHQFHLSMTNVTIFGVFCTHAQKEYFKVLEIMSTYP